MKLRKEIVIEEQDVSAVHSELVDIIDFFCESSDESWVKDEFPNVVRLKRLLDGLVIGEPRVQILEKFEVKEKKEEGTRLRRKFRLVKAEDS